MPTSTEAVMVYWLRRVFLEGYAVVDGALVHRHPIIIPINYAVVARALHPILAA